MADPHLFAFLLVVRTLVAPTLVQQIGPTLPETAFNHGTFRFAPDARAELHELWTESNRVHEERVACIRGYNFNGVFYITAAKRVGFEHADSLHLAPDPESCGAPKWHGTAHTHVARFQGLPFVTFSHADRMVMHWWREKWNSAGAFCVLYSESQAYCEYASRLNGDGTYSSKDPIEEMYYSGNRLQSHSP